jgi:WD40 repeat protein
VDEVLVSLYEDGTMTRWDFAAQEEEAVVGRLPVAVAGWPPFVWSEDGRYIASGERQGGLVVWDVAAGQPQLVLDREMAAVAFSLDGQLLATVDRQQSELYLYNLATGQINRTWAGATAIMAGVAFAPDGQHVAYGAGNEVVVAEIGTGVETAVLTGYPSEQTITQIRWSPDGTALVAGSVNMYGENNAGVNILWEQTADGRWREAFQAGHFYNYGYPDERLVSFNPTGSMVAFESLAREGAPYQIFVYDRQQAALILTVEQHYLASWQSDELLLAVEARGDSWLTQWNVRTSEKVVGVAQRINNIWFGPHSPLFAQLTSSQRNVEIRDWLTDQVVAIGPAGRDLGQVIWSGDGRFLAAASASDGTILIWPTSHLP